ncbi:MAG: hypothetical protein AB7F64_08970 [Gammaproteobacteria bacterium]
MAIDSKDDDESSGTGGSTGNPQMVDFVQLGDDSVAKKNAKRQRGEVFGQEKDKKWIKVERIKVPPDLEVKQRNAEAKGHERVSGGEIVARRAEPAAPVSQSERLAGSMDLGAAANHLDIHPVVGMSAYFSSADNNNSADPRISPEVDQDTQAKEPQLLPAPALRPGAAPTFNPTPTKP